MAYNPGDKYVTPTGIGLYNNLFGLNDPGGPGNAFGGGGMFGDNPFMPVKNAWDFQRNGYGVVDPTEQLLRASQNSTDRFFGGNGENGWSDRWKQWFDTDVQARDANGNPTGRMLLSPYHQTGLRVSQDYGVARDPNSGDIADPWSAPMFQSSLAIRNNLDKNPWLDPNTATSGLRSLAASSPYAMPDPGDYTSAMQGAIGGPGAADMYGQRGLDQTRGLAGDTNFDQYGQRGMGLVGGLANGTNFDQYGMRGVGMTNQLAEANLRQLSRGIDREAQNALVDQLPGVQQAMEVMGLGRSGAGQHAMIGMNKSILEQANRDKQRVMADYTDREANRQAAAINLATQQGYGGAAQKYGSLNDAINLATQQGYGGEQAKFNALSGAMNLGSQIGAQGYGQYANQMGNAALAGLGDRFSANQANRQNEQALFAQQMQNQYGKNQHDMDSLFGMLQGSGNYTMQGLEQERLGQSAAMNDYMNLVNQREGWRTNSMNEMLNLSDRERSIQQDRINQMMQASYMPLDLMTRMTTGISGSNYQGQNSAPWWSGAVGNAMNGIGNGIGNAAAGWASDWITK